MDSGRIRNRDRTEGAGVEAGSRHPLGAASGEGSGVVAAAGAGDGNGVRGESRGFKGHSRTPNAKAGPSSLRKPWASALASPDQPVSSRSPGGKGKGKGTDRESRPQATFPGSRTTPTAQPSTDIPSVRPRVRALSPLTVSHPMPLTELRQLKKEAFAKYHPPRPGPGDRSRTVSAASVSTARPGPMGKGGRGQPNMAARMGVLLERIKSGRAGQR